MTWVNFKKIDTVAAIVIFIVIISIVFWFWDNNKPIKLDKSENINEVKNITTSADDTKIKEIYEKTPTTNTTIKGFSNEIKPLPPATPTKWEVGQDYYEDQIKEYGNLAVRFWADYNSITFLKKFDVDGDGQKEYILGICGLYGNHCPHEVIIIKNDKQIFSYSDTGVNISLPETGNSFYVEWHNSEQYKNGYCCPTGYMKTEFIFKDNKFVPVSEREVLYLEKTN